MVLRKIRRPEGLAAAIFSGFQRWYRRRLECDDPVVMLAQNDVEAAAALCVRIRADNARYRCDLAGGNRSRS